MKSYENPVKSHKKSYENPMKSHGISMNPSPQNYFPWVEGSEPCPVWLRQEEKIMASKLQVRLFLLGLQRDVIGSY